MRRFHDNAALMIRVAAYTCVSLQMLPTYEPQVDSQPSKRVAGGPRLLLGYALARGPFAWGTLSSPAGSLNSTLFFFRIKFQALGGKR